MQPFLLAIKLVAHRVTTCLGCSAAPPQLGQAPLGTWQTDDSGDGARPLL